MHGLWLLPYLAKCSHRVKRNVQRFALQASCQFTRAKKIAGALFVVVGALLVFLSGSSRRTICDSLGKMRGASSSSASPSTSSWALFVRVDCPVAVGVVGVAVTYGVVITIGCLSLLLTRVASKESHFKPSRAAVNQVVWFVRSLWPQWTLVGCRYALMSSSHIAAGLLCFRFPLCLVDIYGFHLKMSFVQRTSWQWQWQWHTHMKSPMWIKNLALRTCVLGSWSHTKRIW